DLFEAFGIRISDLVVPIKSLAGITRVDIGADVNEGRLSVKPSIDTNQEELFIVMPPNLEMLKGMQLDEGMADQLLAAIHPLFHKATMRTRGTVDLVMNRFAWPVDQSQQDKADFAGEIRFSNLRIEAKGMIHEVLTAAKVKEREVDIDEKGFTFECINGRIECSPMKIKVEEYELHLAGSMGLDKTLDYYVEVPLTEELVGESAFEYTEGVTVRIPISGTIDNPKLDYRAMDKILGEMAKQALKKKLEGKLSDKLEEKFGIKIKGDGDKDGEGGTTLEEKAVEKVNDLLKGLFD
ncbi:MAG: hypothetical protein AAF492_28375, partial [Verrucomicrobiota bacterium]